MAELIGLISSIIGIAGAGLALAQKLHDYGDGVSASSRRAQQIAFHVRTTAVCIEEVGSVLEEEELADRVIVSRNALNTVKDIVGQCNSLFEQISIALKNAENGNSMGRLLFPLRESRLVLMQSDLERLKTTLQLLMQVVVYARVRAVQSEYQPRQRQLVEELIALRRQAMDTYQKNKEEDERAETMEDVSIFTAALPNAAAGPSASDNVPQEIPPRSKEDRIANPHSSPIDQQPSPTHDCDPDTSKIIKSTTMQSTASSPADYDSQPLNTSTAPTQDTLELGTTTHIPRSPSTTPIQPPQDDTLHDYLAAFSQSLKFICCCPCLYIHRRSTQTHQHQHPSIPPDPDPDPNPLLGMGLPSYQAGYPTRPTELRYSGGEFTSRIEPPSAETFATVPQAMIYSPSKRGMLSRTGVEDSLFELDNTEIVGVERRDDLDDIEELLKRWTNLYRIGADEGVDRLDGQHIRF